MGRAVRFAAVVAATAVLCAVPALVGRLPATAGQVPLATLLDRARASTSLAYSGLAESRGSLGLPNLPRFGDVAALLSGTTRMRVWYADPQRWRVDRLTVIGEEGTYQDRGGNWRWSSEDRQALRYDGTSTLRLPQPVDLLPPELARRLLAPATTQELRRLPDRRVAGRSAAGLRVVPQGVTTIGRIDAWVDPRSGLPLRIDVAARGGSTPVVTSRFLDVRLARPGGGATRFAPPPDASVNGRDVPDLVAAIDRYGGFGLPDSVAGLPRRVRVQGLGGGAGTYGDGYTVLVVVPVHEGFAYDVVARLVGAGKPLDVAGAPAAGVPSPAVNTFVVAGSPGYVLSGTVPLDLLKRAAAELVRE
jgi:hypothetical protein